jgi:hypothetical protein
MDRRDIGGRLGGCHVHIAELSRAPRVHTRTTHEGLTRRCALKALPRRGALKSFSLIGGFPMQSNKTAIERAFELASSGRCNDITILKKIVSAEGYDARQLEGRAIVKQLKELTRAAAS